MTQSQIVGQKKKLLQNHQRREWTAVTDVLQK